MCETAQSGSPGCFAPVLVRGTVADLCPGRCSPTPTSWRSIRTGRRSRRWRRERTTNGAYELRVAASRDAAGKPVQSSITLRADKQGYQTFPGGVRTALPIDLSGAMLEADNWVVSGPLTALKLAPLTSPGTTFIHGSVAKAPSGAGALVVAEPAAGGAGLTGVADGAGNYAIFNLTPGTAYVVNAYTKGANYTPVTTSPLAVGDNAVATLALGSGTGATLAGGLIFNNGASSNIQVTLVVQSTFVANLDRGESPPGLTIQGGGSGYTFDGVPDGKYVVLAAFGLDGDVRDVSGTGNTAAPQVTIQGGAVVGTPPGFKIIPAVDLLTIGGTVVSATPVVLTGATAPAPIFTWKTGSVDSAADTYRVDVFDSFGTPVFGINVPQANGTMTATYGRVRSAGAPGRDVLPAADCGAQERNPAVADRGRRRRLHLAAVTSDFHPLPRRGRGLG